MSKRYSRRPRNPNLPEHAYNTPVDPVVPAVATVTPTGKVSAAVMPRMSDWRNEYGEVIGDLRRTAVIFVGLVVVMVVLSFVIR